MLISTFLLTVVSSASPTSSNSLQLRRLALYPECSALQILAQRQSCCDEKVQSLAGREFCYSQVDREEGLFEECDIKDWVEMFDCCDNLSGGDIQLAYDCKVGLDGGGYCPPDDEERCKKNYLTGVEAIEKTQ